ncbi:SusC/RagA family TonB-linked outer membrane protein [Flavobacterium columnare NBRC 100251 = ATCC 23463]|uniref:SusC/RagA family TonB-linked outer membrane protein n=1 Tax=Flavobacterium columnare TaxID=996 RepID=A0AAI8CJ00_9FLAO|nr:SusC/RagA family TonB-linked outer membrane protein [Flavobacterium columnare]AMO21091.1 SusC/RagA family TonB-linked outer membrane protein [Flavobacterium columnare]APT21729.1 SusC/RagA family TonB-linked outer membrane protein [Flavobacterium columnare]AUX19104.1 SusC/RagA family TonB-linked outer membrane protein [Flavobacterium columnare]MBF6651458.1 SusC/RagA family TonB-linked outer membrane protein [Flavobacterium columnare]MBF6655185.1 SusC/RagA family TonB-linked outer membrane pr
MRSKFKWIYTLLIVLTVQFSFAQEKTITGVVTDASGPLPGVNVLVKGTQRGSSTGFDGKYSIKAKEGETLIFSFMGMKEIAKTVGASNVMNTVMQNDSKVLGEVVVTAQGISREKKSLGYSTQKLDAATINQVPTNNFINNLSGKVAGLEIRNNSNFGGSSNIVLRGTKSLTGNNQALIIIDGVPINNANLNDSDTASGRQGFDFGNSASDIDPNNIESINVLKGTSATALYGSEAANGAIIITTKKGKKRTALGISLSSTLSISNANKQTLPTYQKEYGGGYAGEGSNYTADIFGNPNAIVSSTGDDASYGNAFNPNQLVYQWNSFVIGNPNYGKATPWVAASNDPNSFFRTAFSTVNNINFNGGDEKSAYNFSYTNNNETGILPNSSLNKNSINGSFSRDFTNKLKSNTFITFTDQSTKGRNATGYGDNIITGFRQWWPVNVDIKELEKEYFRTKQNTTWNQIDPTNGDLRPNFWNNPYWDRYENYETDTRTRVLTGSSLSYDISKNFNILGRATLEYSYDNQELRKAIGSHAENFGITGGNASSGYSIFTRDFLQQTYDLIATYKFNISKDFGTRILGGYTFKKANSRSLFGSTTGGLAKPYLYSLQNSNVFLAPIQSELKYEKSGIYTQGTLDYKKIIYLEGTVRHDESTALLGAENKYNYFSVGTSLILSEIIKKDWLNLAKLRVNYAEVGNDLAFGRLGSRAFNGIIDGNPLFGNSTTYYEQEKLKPEVQRSIETGLELGLYDRFNLDLSFYKTNITNQIFNVPQSGATGFSAARINAGEMENKGIEIALSGSIVKSQKFSWEVGINWSKNINTVKSLNQGRDNLLLANFQGGVSLNATVGEAYGTLRGTDYVYDANGNKVVGSNGFYLTQNNKVLGTIQADWIGGLNNKVRYNDFSLNFLIDVKKGGSVYSLDQAYGQETGIYPETTGLNHLGVPVRSANNGGIILPGVLENGQPNNIIADASSSGGTAFSTDTNPNKAYIYDASYIKLREVGLTYNLPNKYIEKLDLSSISFSLLGSNLWIIHKNTPYSDPEAGSSAGNIQGFQSGVMPAIKTYSFNMKINF